MLRHVSWKHLPKINWKNFHLSRTNNNTRQEQLLRKGLPKKAPIPGVKNIILVSSAKGGVGKSTIAVNLAIALKNEGRLNIGILDADVFGPSIPMLMNLDDSPRLNSADKMVPLLNYGIQCMSMGFLIDKKSAAIWRGLMVMQGVDRLLKEVAWSDIDCLVIDMPPGTGDVQLSVTQNVPITGVVVVSTPQDIALLDTRRGVEMYNKMKVPILGIVQNMSVFCCPSCGQETHLFGKDKLEKLVKELSINMLGNIPLQSDICEGSDNGLPITVSKQQSPSAEAFKQIADNVLKLLPA